jgi:ABC-2 type transport system permease protein
MSEQRPDSTVSGQGSAAGRSARARGRASRPRLVGLVAKREYLRTVRRRGYLFGTLLLPLGIAALMAISAFFSVNEMENGTPGGRIVIVNESDVPIPEASAGPIQVTTLSRDQADARLQAGELSGYYVVPADVRSEGVVTHVQPESAPGFDQLETLETNSSLITALLRSALLDEADVSPETSTRIVQGVTITTVDTTGEEVSGLDVAAGIAVPIVFVGLFMVSIFITSGYLLQSVTEEKENRVVEIVLSSIPSVPLMGGKILGLGGAGLTQVLIWVVTALVALPLLSSQLPDLSAIAIDPTILLLALVYFVLGYLAYGAIFAAIGAIAPGNREAQQYSGFLGFFAAIPFILFSVVATDVTGPLVLALALFPLTTPTTMLLVLGVSPTIPWTLVGASIVSLTLFALLATWASARIFRATVLLYGVRPSLGQLLAAVRSSS